MKYSVLWKPEAFERLFAEYESLGKQGRATAVLTRAAIRIDLLLQREADTCGESRGLRYRILIEPPLTAYYQIDNVNSAANVVSIHVYPSP